jgi:hypothetical protein
MEFIAGGGAIQPYRFIGAIRKTQTVLYPDLSQVPFPILYTVK